MCVSNHMDGYMRVRMRQCVCGDRERERESVVRCVAFCEKEEKNDNPNLEFRIQDANEAMADARTRVCVCVWARLWAHWKPSIFVRLLFNRLFNSCFGLLSSRKSEIIKFNWIIPRTQLQRTIETWMWICERVRVRVHCDAVHKINSNRENDYEMIHKNSNESHSHIYNNLRR